MKKRVLTIGFVAQTYDNSIGVRKDYLHFGETLGRMLSTLKEKVITKAIIVSATASPKDVKVDLLVLPGGADLSLGLQDIGYSSMQGKDDPSYTEFAKNQLQNWVDAGVPIFGICLGMQMLVAFMGGELTPHMDNHALDGAHPVALQRDAEIGQSTFSYQHVNSRHHQGYMLESFKELTSGSFVLDFIPLAFSFDQGVIDSARANKVGPLTLHMINPKEDRKYERFGEGNGTVIEAFRHRTEKIAGVQWHPEELGSKDNITRGDEFTHKLIKWLLSDKFYTPIAGVAAPKEMGSERPLVADENVERGLDTNG